MSSRSYINTGVWRLSEVTSPACDCIEQPVPAIADKLLRGCDRQVQVAEVGTTDGRCNCLLHLHKVLHIYLWRAQIQRTMMMRLALSS